MNIAQDSPGSRLGSFIMGAARVIYFWAGKFYFSIIHFYKRGFFIYEKTFHTFSLG